MDYLFDILDHTLAHPLLAHPLHVHCDLAPQRQTISSHLGAAIAKDRFHKGKPLTI
jgi:hypothetical protein